MRWSPQDLQRHLQRTPAAPPLVTAAKPRKPKQPLPELPTSQITPQEIRLWVPYIVPSLNTILYKNRFAVARKKKVAEKALQQVLQTLPPLTPFPQKVRVHITLYRCRLIDADNVFCKPLIDHLRYQGVLQDDNTDCMELTISQQKVPKRFLEGTLLSLQPILA